jgi:8-oxo-dGTP diphosphatase
MISVAAGILWNAEGKILIALRPSHVAQGGLWEFPGGKIEPGERSYEALVREYREEIGVSVIAAHHFLDVYHDYGQKQVCLHIWWIDEFIGEANGLEGQLIRWVSLSELSNFDFPAANQVIIKKLQSVLKAESPNAKE